MAELLDDRLERVRSAEQDQHRGGGGRGEHDVRADRPGRRPGAGLHRADESHHAAQPAPGPVQPLSQLPGQA